MRLLDSHTCRKHYAGSSAIAEIGASIHQCLQCVLMTSRALASAATARHVVHIEHADALHTRHAATDRFVRERAPQRSAIDRTSDCLNNSHDTIFLVVLLGAVCFHLANSRYRDFICIAAMPI